MLDTLVGQLFLVIVAAISAAGGIYATYVSRKTTDAAAEKSSAESEHIEDQTWINRLDALSKDFNRLQKLSDSRFERLVELERLITEHVSWDFTMVRLAREHGWEIEDPPSLVYVKQELQKEKAIIEREINGNGK